ncbi:exopolyphosphatase-like protein [Candidatus Magnetobacterium bavaricum]|uniref:Exopolyphosphatase-like protein n=1 Tax=Candidatus Magnetobacterium bavaricum TaxID=29290 RepID=A0A0F3GPN4_9BACT|nr:exopolyphosphatase-like protein [Candidatus Magnetobacterium bavaricum]
MSAQESGQAREGRCPEGLVSYLKEADDFRIVVHVFPDGDAIGSALALSLGLRAMGKRATVYSKDDIPQMFGYLPSVEDFRDVNLITQTDTADATLIVVDCNSAQRAGLSEVRFKKTVVIDHHVTETDFGDIRWVMPDYPATGLMVYFLLKELGVNITTEMATNVYTALSIDTGTFRFANTTAETLQVAAELVNTGVNPSAVANYIYNTWSEARFLLLKNVLNSVEIHNKLAMTFITEAMFRETGARVEDSDNFVNFPIMIESVVVSALFKEIGPDKWKVSLRCQDGIDVSVIAQELGGGGHKNAAGFRITGSLVSVKQRLIESFSGG